MKDLFENFKYFLVEEKKLYKTEITVRAEPGSQLHDDIFEKIRAIEGVTVIRSTEAIKRDERNNKLMNISVRFYIDSANTIPYLEKLKNTIRTFKDSDGDGILSVSIRKLPERVSEI